jgi:hypothetical protein
LKTAPRGKPPGRGASSEMAITELTCGCRMLNQACVISPTCRASPKHSAENPPGGGRLGAVPSTPTAARKKAEAKESGRKLKPGRWRWNAETGKCEAVEGKELG